MNESEKLLVVSLKQMGCLPTDKTINSLADIEQREFGFIVTNTPPFPSKTNSSVKIVTFSSTFLPSLLAAFNNNCACLILNN